MPSTFPSTVKGAGDEPATTNNLRWRSWPLVDHVRWSWLVVLVVPLVAGVVVYLGQSWLLGVAAAASFAATIWPFFVPVWYEISNNGLQRRALGRTRQIPWPAIRAYQLQTTGVVLYGRVDATAADLLRSLFVPYPADEDELLCAIRQNLPHAVELD